MACSRLHPGLRRAALSARRPPLAVAMAALPAGAAGAVQAAAGSPPALRGGVLALAYFSEGAPVRRAVRHQQLCFPQLLHGIRARHRRGGDVFPRSRQARRLEQDVVSRCGLAVIHRRQERRARAFPVDEPPALSALVREQQVPPIRCDCRRRGCLQCGVACPRRTRHDPSRVVTYRVAFAAGEGASPWPPELAHGVQAVLLDATFVEHRGRPLQHPCLQRADFRAGPSRVASADLFQADLPRLSCFARDERELVLLKRPEFPRPVLCRKESCGVARFRSCVARAAGGQRERRLDDRRQRCPELVHGEA